jgi:hypothetical protein
MNYFEALGKLISAQISEGAIGQPVFVRLDLELTADHGLLATLAAAGVEAATGWLGAPPRSLYAQGGSKHGLVSALVEMASGASALVGTQLARGEPSARVLLVGQHGTLRFDDFPLPAQLAEMPVPSRALTAWIEQSLAAAKPVAAARI